jgi:hypothetical protein
MAVAPGMRESHAIDASGLLQLGLKPRQNRAEAVQTVQSDSSDAQNPVDDATAMRRLEQSYRGMRVRSTPFPGIYDLSNPGQEDVAPILVDADNHFTANNGVAGWHDARTGASLPQKAVGTLHANALPHLPLRDAILLGDSSKPVRIAVMSAIECIPCLAFEKDMKTAGIAYYVFPTSLFDENRATVAAIWCQADRAQAWTNAMGKHVFPRSTPPQCNYPDREIRVLRAFYSYLTPTLLYADGTTSAYRGMEPLRERMATLERSGAAFPKN